MRRLLIALPVALLCVTAFSADLLECVNPDVRRGLLFIVPADGDLDISDQMPEEIAALPVPADFAWLANRSRPDGQTSVFLASSDPQAALDAAMTALATDGWQPDRSNMPVSAFESPAMDRSQTACRDGEAMSVSTRRLEDTTYALYFINANSERSSCRVSPGLGGGNFMENPNLPEFDFTALGSRGMPRSRSGSGLGNNIRTSMQLRLTASLGDVASQLAEQLADLGWQRDTSWAGSVMAGSTWARTRADQQRLSGALDVVDRGDGSFQITFALAELR